jgi:hypothetical protein
MAKNRASGRRPRSRAVRERSHVQNPVKGGLVKLDSDNGDLVDSMTVGIRGGREILFPTEPSTIGHKRIDRAVERVLSRKK